MYKSRFEGLVNNLEAGVVIHASDTSIIFANPKASELLGLTQDQLMGKVAIDSNWKFLFEDNSPLPAELYPVNQIVAKKNIIKNLTFGINRPLTNDIKWVQVNGFPILNPDESIKEVVISFIDVSEQKNQSNIIRENNERLSFALSASNAGTWDWDMETGKLYWSKELFHLYGLDPDKDEASFENWQKVIHPDDYEAASKNIENSIKEKKSLINEYRVFASQGKLKWISATGESYFDKSGKPIRMAGICIDITERKKHEESLAIANAQLESFNYSVSHDLRSPLNNIMCFNNIILKDHESNLNSEAKECFQSIKNATNRMNSVLDGLVTISRVARTELEIKPVNLSSLVQGLADELHKLDSKRDVKFIIQENVIVRGDLRLFTIAISNLMNNAFKFTSNKSHAVIEFGRFKEDEREVYFIRDNGAGFDERHSSKLFKPFERLHSFSEYSGTGIGLATVKRAIERHGGKVWAQAEPDKGAIFYFSL